jgi:hypothetical protein
VDFLAQEAARIEVAARLGEEQVCLPVSAWSQIRE